MKQPAFVPGFRFSLFDGLVLFGGGTGIVVLSSIVWWWGFVLGFVLGHFFLFCNVVRMTRLLELLWSGVFVMLAAATIVLEKPGWLITALLSLVVTGIVVVVALRRPSYHGVGWKRLNPGLPEWWESHVADRAGEAQKTERRTLMRANRIWSLALLGFLSLSSLVPVAGAQQAATAKEPDPMKIIQQMCDYLVSLKQFYFRSEVTDDQVYYGGKKLQYGIDMETYVRRPDRLLVNADGDLVNKQFFFNGKTITLYDRKEKVYGTIEVPADIEGALAKADRDFGLKVALTDLVSPLLWDHISKKVQHALYVGMARVRGVPCHHLAFDGSEVHLQVWIETGDTPLPRKVVFLQKKLEGSPQWTAYLSDWNTSITLGDGLFTFVAPPGVRKIKFAPVKKAAPPDPKQGGNS